MPTAASRSLSSCLTRSRRIFGSCRTRLPTSTSATPSSGSAEGAAVKYEVVHTTRYDYSRAVSVSHHLARLMPRALPRQACAHHELHIDPVPEVTMNHVDYFGN